MGVGPASFGRVCSSLPDRLWNPIARPERRLLHKVVRACRPRVFAEVGTWKGGGSAARVDPPISVGFVVAVKAS